MSEPENTELHNELVTITALCPLDYDGNPDVEGVEHYEAGDTLTVTRLVADAFVKAGIAILTEEAGA